ncbi:MAG: hypothetical protein ACLR67_01100 [Eggerthella lenta]
MVQAVAATGARFGTVKVGFDLAGPGVPVRSRSWSFGHARGTFVCAAFTGVIANAHSLYGSCATACSRRRRFWTAQRWYIG